MKSTTPQPTNANPFSGVFLLMATILAAELAMLNIIFWARAQGTITGLAVATIWPWVVAFSAPVLWSASRHWFAARSVSSPVVRPGLAAGAGLALMAVVLAGRLTLFA